MEQALAQFILHPTFLGGVVVLIAAAVYGLIRGTAALTRISVAAEAMRSEMVGLRSDFSTMRDSQRTEHDKTREEVQLYREEVLRVSGAPPERATDPREERPWGSARASRPR